MKALLVFPPVADPAHPPLGIASIASFVKAHEESVHCLDLNIHSYIHFLRKENLRQCAGLIDDRIRELEALDSLTRLQALEYSFLSESQMSTDFVIKSIDRALSSIRKEATYRDRGEYQKGSQIIRRAMDIVSAAHYPSRWTVHGFSMSSPTSSSRNVLEAIVKRKENPFIQYAEEQIDAIERIQPSVVGLSLNYYSQLIPCMTLAKELKRRRGDITIVIGGSLVAFFKDRWHALHPFRNFVDIFVPYEGEKPFLDIIEARKTGKPWRIVPGIVYFKGNAAFHNPSVQRKDIATAPTPDFGDFPLEDYWSPEVIIPYMASKGCYWGKCAFCSHRLYYPGNYTCKSAEQVLKDLRTLSVRYNTRHFFFIDDAIHPSLARRISDHIRDRALPYHWYCEMRLESTLDEETIKLLSKGGCRLLLFGLESGSRRVLGQMDKGITLQDSGRILKTCVHAGINTFVTFMIGFPTETRQEAEATRKFIENNSRFITHVGFGSFALVINSEMYANPEKFGIKAIKEFPDADFTVYADYENRTGMTRKESSAVVNDLRKNWHMRALYDFPLLSRNHLSFLPHKPLPVSRPGEASPRIYERRPAITRGVISGTACFDLVKIRSLSAPSQPLDSFDKKPTPYLYDPVSAKLLCLDRTGLLLIGLCNGKNRMGDILRLAGKKNKRVVMEFYRTLFESGFLK